MTNFGQVSSSGELYKKKERNMKMINNERKCLKDEILALVVSYLIT